MTIEKWITTKIYKVHIVSLTQTSLYCTDGLNPFATKVTAQQHVGRMPVLQSSNLQQEHQCHQSAELQNLLNLLWMKPHMAPKLVTWQKQGQLSFGTEISLSLFNSYCIFNIFLTCENGLHFINIHTYNCYYSTKQAVSMVMDDQWPNVLAADSDSGSVWELLCWLHC